MALQTIHRGIRQLKFALWTSENSYGTAHLVRGARNMGVEIEVESDRLMGDDVLLDQFAKPIGAIVNMEMATIDLLGADLFTGGTFVSNAAYEDLMFSENDDVPYVAIAARIASTGSTGDLQIFIPKAKLNGNLRLTAQVQTYLLPGAQFQGVSEGATNGIYRIRNFATKTALEIPLRTAVGGL